MAWLKRFLDPQRGLEKVVVGFAIFAAMGTVGAIVCLTQGEIATAAITSVAALVVGALDALLIRYLLARQDCGDL